MNNQYQWLLSIPFAVSAISILFAFIMLFRVLRRSQGETNVIEIASSIHQSVQIYLRRFFVWVFSFALALILIFIVQAFLAPGEYYEHIFSFVSGIALSLVAGIMGTNMASFSNTRAISAAKHSLNRSLRVAFTSGAAIGMNVIGLGLLLLVAWLTVLYSLKYSWQKITSILLYMAMGSSFIALFARVGGGIYTRAVSSGADILRSIEKSLPENDTRNPLFIVGSAAKNITGIISMSTDLLESYIGSLVATIALAAVEFPDNQILAAVLAPLLVASVGIIASILGTFLIRSLRNENTVRALMLSYRIGTYFTHLLVIFFSWLIIRKILYMEWPVFFALLFGLVGGIFLSLVSHYYTSMQFSPSRRVARSSEIDPATFLLSGLSVGMKSTVFPIFIFTSIVFFIMLVYDGNFIWSLYLAGMGAVGMVSALGITLAGEAFGPIAENAANVAQVAHQEQSVVERLELVNHFAFAAASSTRGFSIGAALFTTLSLLAVLDARLHLSVDLLPVMTPQGLSAIFIGIMLPIFFSSLSVESVSRAALLMVAEVKRQFREISGIMEGREKPDYIQCVKVSSAASLKKMTLPAMLAFLAPILVGLFLGGAVLLLTIVSAIAMSFVLSLLLTTAGGTWASVKKDIEKGAYGGRGSSSYKASVIGESFGNPLLYSLGPELNILIKVMVITSLIFLEPILHFHKLWFLF